MKKVFLTFFLAFIFLINVQSAFSRELKIAILSDVHIRIAQDESGNYKLTQTINNLQHAIAQLNNSNVDCVVFLGDNIDMANKESITMFAKIVNNLKKPYYVILGNHDVAQVSGLDKKKYFHLLNRFSKNKVRKVPSSKSHGDIAFVFMDGVNQFIPGARGYYREPELIWLNKKLEKYKNKKVIIFQHYPLVPPYKSNSHETSNADEYLKLLQNHKNVVAVVSGHYHGECEVLKDGITHISVPTLQEGTYKEIDIDYKILDNKDYVMRTKIHSIKE